MQLSPLPFLKEKNVIAAWVCVALVVVTVSYLFIFQDKLRRREAKLARTQETLTKLYDLQNNLAVAETAARGFVITRDPEHLEPFHDVCQEVQQLLLELRLRLRDNPQRRELQFLQELIERRLRLLDDLISSRQSDRPERELAEKTAAGKQLQDRIRIILQDLEQEEQRQAEEHGARAKARAGRWPVAFWLGTLVSFTLLSLVLYFLHQEIRERQGVEEKLQQYQEKLRSLASQLTLAEERERRRIAVHLHDNIGQKLALATIKLGQLREAASGGEDLGTAIDESRQLLKQTIQETKSLTFKISSPILYELGLEAALEWLTEELQKQHGISAYFEDDHQAKPVNDDLRILLYQAANELLMNVVKHSRARSVQVNIWREGDRLRLGVYDDGLGFHPQELGSRWSKRNGGFGLFSIRERLNPFGGVLEVESKPGLGTQVTMSVPLQADPVLLTGGSREH